MGFAFGVVLMKSEAISWFRIQEMFRFQSIHMFGILGCAVGTAAIALQVLQRMGARSLDGQQICLEPKTMGTGARYAIGGTCFGLGWSLIGACPGPLFALLGAGIGVMGVAILVRAGRHVDLRDAARRLPH